MTGSLAKFKWLRTKTAAANTTLLIVLSFVLGIGLGIGQPLSIATTVESLPNNKIGEGLGLRLTINRLTQLLTPISMGGVATIVGFGGVFYSTGAIVVVGILGFIFPRNLKDN
ncbi:MFS transporter [Lentibacillus salicampi]|uniref:MFS transporter n=1 Tax=Lentibacillus salicampi TaxID=175306 RepID=A0A4Y9A7N0_9BACI|nr:MFS transporter [Lentibacillus salicampi]TFJ89934.1 MFS transporter [Lentibacillus salicampi]